MAVPPDLKYTAEHEWLRIDGDVATVGITAFAADKLGDVVFLELPEPGTSVSSGRVVGEIESTKSVGELFAPVDGEVVTVNSAAVESPELVNSDPYGEGWLISVRFAELPELLAAGDYTALVGE